MAHYRKVETKIWNDERFISLSAHGKLAYLFILTHPHMTALGAMRTTVPGLTFELPDIPAKAFREVFAKGLAKADEKACMVWLPNFLYYNSPESPNVVRSWPNAFDLLPECFLKEKLLQTMKAFTEGLSEGFGQAFHEGFAEALAKSSRKTSPNPEQEQEQEQDKEPPYPLLDLSQTPDNPKRLKSGSRAADFQNFYQHYPRKMKPGDAEKAFEAAKRKVGVEPIMAGLLAQLESEMLPAYNREGENITPYPATWLRSASWDNEIVHKNGRPQVKNIDVTIETVTEKCGYRIEHVPETNLESYLQRLRGMNMKLDEKGVWRFAT